MITRFGQNEKKEYKPLKMFSAQTDELKKLIAEHPDYPIVVIVNYEVCGSDDYCWWYAPSISFSIGDLLDIEQDINDEKVYIDRNDFEDDLIDVMYDMDEFADASDDVFVEAFKQKLAEYEPYWKKVIQIKADV